MSEISLILKSRQNSNVQKASKYAINIEVRAIELL